MKTIQELQENFPAVKELFRCFQRNVYINPNGQSFEYTDLSETADCEFKAVLKTPTSGSLSLEKLNKITNFLVCSVT
jgi:hypothetical protein